MVASGWRLGLWCLTLLLLGRALAAFGLAPGAPPQPLCGQQHQAHPALSPLRLYLQRRLAARLPLEHHHHHHHNHQQQQQQQLPRGPVSPMMQKPSHQHRGALQAHAPDVPPPPPKRPESAQNFLYWILSWAWRGDALLPEVRPVVACNMVATALISYFHRRGLVVPIDITPHSLLSGALGFFLTFRANEGYNRCSEARAVWDGVLDTSRDIIRTVVACGPLLEDDGGGYGRRARRLLDLTCAYGVLLEEFVTGTTRGEEQLRRLLTPADLEAIDWDGGRANRELNRPLIMTELIAEEVAAAGREHPEFQGSPYFLRLLGFVDQLGHHVTRTQRLSKPPVPPIFFAHALRFVTLWTFTLPFALLDKIPSAALLVPAMGMVTWALFGLRELGVKTQYPFACGYVDLQRLWREVMWDRVVATEAVPQEEEAAGDAGTNKKRE